MRLSEAQARKLLGTQSAPRKKRVERNPPGQGHKWEPEGAGFRCKHCTMWLAASAMANWSRGYYHEEG